MNFPEIIKQTRIKLGETQEMFAKRFNTHANTVSRWESGQYQAPYDVLAFVLSERKPHMDERYRQEVLAVKELGEQIGYGNMMSIASGLWARDLAPRGMQSGAFVPTIAGFMKEEEARRAVTEQTRMIERLNGLIGNA